MPFSVIVWSSERCICGRILCRNSKYRVRRGDGPESNDCVFNIIRHSCSVRVWSMAIRLGVFIRFVGSSQARSLGRSIAAKATWCRNTSRPLRGIRLKPCRGWKQRPWCVCQDSSRVSEAVWILIKKTNWVAHKLSREVWFGNARYPVIDHCASNGPSAPSENAYVFNSNRFRRGLIGGAGINNAAVSNCCSVVCAAPICLSTLAKPGVKRILLAPCWRRVDLQRACPR